MRTAVLASLLATAAAAQTNPCPTIPSNPTDGPNASPENHTVVFEDADIRVLDVHSRPHSQEAVHTHPRPAVMYVDQQGAGTYRTPDNSRNESHPTNPNFKPRIFATKPEGSHWTENTGDVPFHAIRVEFKHPGCGLPGWHPAKPAPNESLGTDTVLLENEDVRVLDILVPPHSTESEHSHPWPAIEYLANAAPSLAHTHIVPTKANTTAFGNITNFPFHIIRFELKYGTPTN